MEHPWCCDNILICVYNYNKTELNGGLNIWISLFLASNLNGGFTSEGKELFSLLCVNMSRGLSASLLKHPVIFLRTLQLFHHHLFQRAKFRCSVRSFIGIRHDFPPVSSLWKRVVFQSVKRIVAGSDYRYITFYETEGCGRGIRWWLELRTYWPPSPKSQAVDLKISP